MVKILSNGEIVQDSDPRAKEGNQSNARPRQGYIRHDNNEQQQQGQYGQGPSIFDTVNQRLLQAGVPRWNVMQYTVEPIVSVGFLVALLLGGFRGLLFAGALFFVCKWSQGTDNTGSQGSRRPGGGGDTSGGGHTLGR